ncbi:MAG: TVP38/TMEM64 family protein [Bauldia sp.]
MLQQSPLRPDYSSGQARVPKKRSDEAMKIDPTSGRPLLVLGSLAIASIALLLLLQTSGFLAYISDPDAVQRSVQSLGAFGPAILIGLMILAIVASPIPITIAGSALGSMVAFGIARFFAYDAVRRWSAVRRPLEWLEEKRSQSWLMVAVFVSRLVPFTSFDAVSYAAGLTPLSFWRFTLATIAGVAPISLSDCAQDGLGSGEKGETARRRELRSGSYASARTKRGHPGSRRARSRVRVWHARHNRDCCRDYQKGEVAERPDRACST